MVVKKFTALTLGLGLAFTIANAPVCHAGNHAVNLVEVVHKHYVQMCDDADLRHLCLMYISGSADESFLHKYENYMLKNSKTFQDNLVSKLSNDEKFRKNYLKFLKGCEKYKKHYEDFINKRPKALKYPPTW